MPPPAIQIGISSCLLGEPVRYDGNHKRDPYIIETLGRVFTFVPLCPEVGAGLGVPRDSIRLAGDPAAPRAVGVRNPEWDVTEPLQRYARQAVSRLAGISGYILKNRSPSCGMARVKIYQPGGPPRMGRGLFAAALQAAHPLLPVEEEGRLGDPVLRENFVERVFAHHRWQQLTATRLTPRRLIEFHAAHKLILMSHGVEHYRRLGQLVANAGGEPLPELAERYFEGFMLALGHRATRKRHTNGLHHLLGYLKRVLSKEDKAELVDLIETYRLGQVPLIVPITLLNHHFRRHPHPYIKQQLYLHPHPRELMLRNAI